ncbi:MAG: DUF4442 domain-containing protein [Rubrobacter sp.]|nr:DUF4442 domain-containing protein [Rubrobacter sp.]
MLRSLKSNMPGGGSGRLSSARAEALRAGMWRWGFNLFPAFRGTGARVDYIAPDLREVLVRIPLGWRTRNYVGTTFGGSMYAAVDPFYAIMLMQNLGSDFIVWDKAAAIRYRRPGRTTLYARFVLGEEELSGIREELAAGGSDGRGSVDRVYQVDLTDASGEVHATVEKTLYILRKAAVQAAAVEKRSQEEVA